MSLQIYESKRVSSQDFPTEKMKALRDTSVGDMDDIVEKGVFQEVWNKDSQELVEHDCKMSPEDGCDHSSHKIWGEEWTNEELEDYAKSI